MRCDNVNPILGEGAQILDRRTKNVPICGGTCELPHAETATGVGVLLEQLRVRTERENNIGV